ncbi:MAG TPA: carboxymuconolactone decarboxylase family protein [Thermodesulfobacteriota bacterium]|nr:carboxymuconolactone decarboxylase family protein [Thermodesulfobacteriota bacterium]
MPRGDREKRVKKLLAEMEKERGYVSLAKNYVATVDPDFMEAYNNLYNNGLRAGRALPVKYRELVAIAILSYRTREDAVYLHMKRALRHGATVQELLEAVETSIIPGGGPTFDTGTQALMRILEEEKEKKKKGGPGKNKR